MPISRKITALAVGGALTLSACGGAHHAASAAAPSMTMPPASAATPSSTVPVATGTVAIKNFTFAPAAVTVPAGTTVTWTNDDGEAHTVTSTRGPLHSPAMQPGATFSYRFTKPGTYSYLCTIHPYMRGTVVVTR